MPDSFLLHPVNALKLATEAVPAVRYAVGLVGVAAAIALVRSFLPGVEFAGMLPIIGAAIVAMAILIILAAAVAAPGNTAIAQTFLWATCIFVITFMLFTVSAVAFGWPPAWARLVLPASAIERPLFSINDEAPTAYAKPDGKIEKIGEEWIESDPGTGIEFRFEEVNRDDGETLILDRSRGVYMRWPTNGGLVRWSRANPVSWAGLYYVKPLPVASD